MVGVADAACLQCASNPLDANAETSREEGESVMPSELTVYRGDVQDDRDQHITDLEEEVRDLRKQLSAAKADVSHARDQAARAVFALRKQLSPLYKALQAVFGEIEASGIGNDTSDAPQPTGRTTAIWDSWKKRLGPSAASVIDALMLQPGMNTTQLAIAIGKNRQAIPNIIFALNKAGLIDKNGGRFSLKQL